MDSSCGLGIDALCASTKAQTQHRLSPRPRLNLPRRHRLQRLTISGKNSGNYTVQQSIEFGYRDSMIGGNLNNYNTFENLTSGLRLFDYTRGYAVDRPPGTSVRQSVLQQLRLRRRSKRRFAPANRKEQVVRLSRVVPARQGFLELQPARQSAEPREAQSPARRSPIHRTHSTYPAGCRITI